ncbi:MAG: hypothetical protein K2J67_11615 [Lachnospiraceae bacterium]|nr:hypothetical protein [Lachnospiraceae bacterium]
MFGHQYFTDIKGRIHTKLVQMQCEIESQDENFPFEFSERYFCCGHVVPELRNEHMIIHIAQSKSPISLPSKADYKYDLTFNNDPLCRQMKFDFLEEQKYVPELYYGILVFGSQRGETFCRLQFPEPGYKGIADYIDIPLISLVDKQDETKTFERKKAVLREEFLAHSTREGAL